MRYLIDPEYRPSKADPKQRVSAVYAAELKRELSTRNQRWAVAQDVLHEVTMGSVPAVLYREDEWGRHGNFLRTSYQQICNTPDWKGRLDKVHSSAKRSLLSRDPGRSELDSSNSSDALLMNIFCHPETLASRAVCQLLNIVPGSQPVFGHKPRVPLLNGRKDCTEVDMKLEDLFLEAKLTEFDFQQAPRRLVERYLRFKDVFDVDQPDLCGETVGSYQLIRCVLAADAHPGFRFCVLCDARRPDLFSRWHQVLKLVLPYDLRCRLLLLTWQELASALPVEVREFLEVKYGIMTT